MEGAVLRETIEIELTLLLALFSIGSSSCETVVHFVIRTEPWSGSPRAGQTIIWQLGGSSLHYISLQKKKNNNNLTFKGKTIILVLPILTVLSVRQVIDGEPTSV